jgi:hypothetical protein
MITCENGNWGSHNRTPTWLGARWAGRTGWRHFAVAGDAALILPIATAPGAYVHDRAGARLG